MTGGIDPFFNDAEKKEGEDDMKKLSKCKLECDFTWTNNDKDLPEQSECGIIESCAAQMNPGQLVLAMAEQIAELGGHIATNCSVENVTRIQEKLEIKC